jgi:hypothetical protein
MNTLKCVHTWANGTGYTSSNKGYVTLWCWHLHLKVS